MKKKNIYVGVVGDKGSYVFISVLKSGGEYEEDYLELGESTPNRALIVGITEILKSIEPSCKVTINAPVNIGFQYIDKMLEGKSARKWANKDVGALLVNAIEENKLKVSFKCYEKDDKSELASLIKSKFKLKSKKTCENTQKSPIFAVEGNKYNANPLANIDVSIFIRGSGDYATEDRIGIYYVILSYKGREKEISKVCCNTTSNRMIIQGAIDSIELLKRPCNIKLFTHTPIGLTKYNKSQTGVNKDLLGELFELIKKGNHSLESITTMYRQDELEEKLNNKKTHQ